jgi:hypothetical protein
VRITCVYEERAQGLLCSVHQARRAHVSAFHDPERFSERDTALADYHPAFHTDRPAPATSSPNPRQSRVGAGVHVRHVGGRGRHRDAVPARLAADTARAAVEHVCGALMKAGTRQSAYEALRRDRHARALLDLPRRSWTALLKALLGNPHPAYAATSAGAGPAAAAARRDLDLLLRDDDLILALALAAPSGGGGESS